MRAKCLALVMVLASASSALVRAYSVEPVKANWSGWTPWLEPNNYVSEVLTVNFDSLEYVELFAGEYGQGGAYGLEVLTWPGGSQVGYQSEGTYLRPYHWVLFEDLTVTHPERVVKGTRLEFRFTRSGADSIEFYSAEAPDGGPYQYGELKVGGTEEARRA